MYGYVNPDKPNLLMKDYVLYRAYYCGVCKHIGRTYGQIPRLTTNYDIVFLAALAFDCARAVPDVKRQSCVLNPFLKKGVVQASEILDRVCAANIIIAYHKLLDDRRDKSGGGMRRALLGRAYRKARQKLPALDAEIQALQERLFALESAGERSPDILGDCSGKMLQSAATAVVPEASDAAQRLAYSLGKWVYFADAFDDFEEDAHKERFNPLRSCYGAYPSRTALFAAHGEEITFLFHTAIGAAAGALKELESGFSGRILDNIVLRGLRQKTDILLSSTVKLPKSRV